jgi:hypothetical protein
MSPEPLRRFFLDGDVLVDSLPSLSNLGGAPRVLDVRGKSFL